MKICNIKEKEERVHKLNMKTLEDYNNIGAIPSELPKFNNLEAYLIPHPLSEIS